MPCNMVSLVSPGAALRVGGIAPCQVESRRWALALASGQTEVPSYFPRWRHVSRTLLIADTLAWWCREPRSERTLRRLCPAFVSRPEAEPAPAARGTAPPDAIAARRRRLQILPTGPGRGWWPRRTCSARPPGWPPPALCCRCLPSPSSPQQCPAGAASASLGAQVFPVRLPPQVLFRVVTFGLNAFTLRYLSRELIGVVNVRWGGGALGWEARVPHPDRALLNMTYVRLPPEQGSRLWDRALSGCACCRVSGFMVYRVCR